MAQTQDFKAAVSYDPTTVPPEQQTKTQSCTHTKGSREKKNKRGKDRELCGLKEVSTYRNHKVASSELTD